MTGYELLRDSKSEFNHIPLNKFVDKLADLESDYLSILMSAEPEEAEVYRQKLKCIQEIREIPETIREEQEQQDNG